MIDPDLRTIRRDDQMLDRLGRGEPAGDDDVEAMLSAWRSTLPTDCPADPRLLAAIAPEPAPKKKRRLARASVGVAASFALVGGGVTVAAAYADPDSPLWPVTRFMYGGLADSRQALEGASQAVTDAKVAADQRRYPEAARLLAAADALADKVDEPADERRLRDAIAGIRKMLPAGAKAPANTPKPANPTESLGVETPPAGPDAKPAPDTEPNTQPEAPGTDPEAGQEQSGNGEDQPGGNQPPNEKPPHKGKGKKTETPTG